MHPESAAVQKMPDAAGDVPRKLRRALGRIAGEVDHHIRIKYGNAIAKVTSGLLDLTVQMDVLDARPGRMRAIRILLSAADAEDGVASLKEARRQCRYQCAPCLQSPQHA